MRIVRCSENGVTPLAVGFLRRGRLKCRKAATARCSPGYWVGRRTVVQVVVHVAEHAGCHTRSQNVRSRTTHRVGEYVVAPLGSCVCSSRPPVHTVGARSRSARGRLHCKGVKVDIRAVQGIWVERVHRCRGRHVYVDHVVADFRTALGAIHITEV